MRPLLSVLLGVFVLSAATTAQITIHNTDFSAPGFAFTVGNTDSVLATFNVGPAGANQNWTLGDQTWRQVIPTSCIAPAAAPFGSYYPTATRVMYQAIGHNDDTYIWERITPNAYIWLGVCGDSLDEVLVYTQEANMIPLPATYGSNWTTIQRFTADGGGITITNIDSAISTVDGWGTVTTPFGQWQALRIFTHHWFTMLVDDVPMMTFQRLAYGWVNQQGNVVAGLNGQSNDLNPNFSQGHVEMMGVPLAAEPSHGPVASQVSLNQNYPNPFNPSTEIQFNVPVQTHVQLTIYNSLGQIVTTLVDGSQPAGACTVTWNGTNSNGSNVASGLYIYKLTAGAFTQAKTMLLAR